MKINEVYQPKAKNLEMQNLQQNAKKTQGATAKDVQTAGNDKLSISGEAKGLQHTDQLVRREFSQIPDARMEKVAAAKARLSEGFYHQPENTDDIAGALLNESPVAHDAKTKALVNDLIREMDTQPDVRGKNVAGAINRRSDGTYNLEEPIRKAGENLWIPPIQRL